MASIILYSWWKSDDPQHMAFAEYIEDLHITMSERSAFVALTMFMVLLFIVLASEVIEETQVVNWVEQHLHF